MKYLFITLSILISQEIMSQSKYSFRDIYEMAIPIMEEMEAKHDLKTVYSSYDVLRNDKKIYRRLEAGVQYIIISFSTVDIVSYKLKASYLQASGLMFIDSSIANPNSFAIINYTPPFQQEVFLEISSPFFRPGKQEGQFVIIIFEVK